MKQSVWCRHQTTRAVPVPWVQCNRHPDVLNGVALSGRTGLVVFDKMKIPPQGAVSPGPECVISCSTPERTTLMPRSSLLLRMWFLLQIVERVDYYLWR